MSKCESNVNELIVPGLVGIPGTVSSRLAEYRDWRGDVQADVSDLETCASNLEIQGLALRRLTLLTPAPVTRRSPLSSVTMRFTLV